MRSREAISRPVPNRGTNLAVFCCVVALYDHRLEFSMIAAEDLKRLANIPGPCLTIAEPVRIGTTLPAKTAAHLEAAGREAEMLLARRGIEEG